MRPILYGHLVSPPVRGVMMLIRQLNLDVEFKKVDLFKRENWTPEYLKMNQMHTVPTLTHGDVVATDSHSILMYLVDKFAPDSTLFPKSLNERTEIVNKLMFNAAFFFQRDSAVFRSIIHEGMKDISSHEAKVHEAYDCLETFLTKHKFVAGPSMTIADFAILPTASTLDYLFPIVETKWPKFFNWFSDCKKLPHYEEANQKGLDELKEFLEKVLKFSKN